MSAENDTGSLHVVLKKHDFISELLSLPVQHKPDQRGRHKNRDQTKAGRILLLLVLLLHVEVQYKIIARIAAGAHELAPVRR